MVIDSFSGSLGELPKGRRALVYALAVLADDPRVSTFERGAGWLESLLHELQFNKLVIEDKAEPYPWHRFNLTDAGRQMLSSGNTPNVRANRPRSGPG